MTDSLSQKLEELLPEVKHLSHWELEQLRVAIGLEHAHRLALYEASCNEEGEVPCNVITGHVWVVSDENEEDCYCENCGCREY